MNPITSSVRKLIDIDQLSSLWRIPKATLYNWVNQGRIPYIKLGRCLRFDLAEIQRMEERSRMGTADRR